MKTKIFLITTILTVGMFLSGCSLTNTLESSSKQEVNTKEAQTEPSSSPTTKEEVNDSITQEEIENITIEDDFNTLVK